MIRYNSFIISANICYESHCHTEGLTLTVPVTVTVLKVVQRSKIIPHVVEDHERLCVDGAQLHTIHLRHEYYDQSEPDVLNLAGNRGTGLNLNVWWRIGEPDDDQKLRKYKSTQKYVLEPCAVC